MSSKPFVGDIGTVITVNTQTDLTDATVLKLMVLKPDESEVEWVGTKYNSTYIRFVTRDGDLNLAGEYKVQAYIETPTWQGKGRTATFTVYAAYS
jgi:hypothetical protein